MRVRMPDLGTKGISVPETAGKPQPLCPKEQAQATRGVQRRSNLTAIHRHSDQGQEPDNYLNTSSVHKDGQCALPIPMLPSFPDPATPVEWMCPCPACAYGFTSWSIASPL